MTSTAVEKLGISTNPGGVRDPHHPLEIKVTARRGAKMEPVLAILKENIGERRTLFAARIAIGRVEKRGNFVTPGGADTLADMFGKDVVEEALASGTIRIG